VTLDPPGLDRHDVAGAVDRERVGNELHIGNNANGQVAQTPGFVDAISVGISTANSDYPSGGGNGQVLNSGHLYVEFWANHLPILTYPLQAGDVNGRIRAANFTQNPYTDPHFYFALTPTQTVSLSETLVYKKNVYESNGAAGNAPAYDPVNLNSNSWADGLLLSAAISQGTIDQVVNKLVNATLGARYPYAYGAGNTMVPLF